MPTKFQLITELYDQTVQSVTGSYQSWTGFLRAACYNYKCPFDDQILIYAQRPDATAVLEMERWNRQFGRWVNRGAKSIAVFGDDGQNCLKLYFDVSDTHASRFARPLPIWTMHPAFEPEVIETLEATFGNLAEKENLADAVRSACHNAVADNITDYLQDLRDCREDSLLEELDDLNLEVFYRDALEVSVAYMLMTRLGLRADDYFSPDEFAHVYEFNTPPTINALGIATSDIAEMGLREISRTVMQAQRDQFFANRARIGYDDRTEQHEAGRERSKQYGGHLQDTERLSGAEFDDAQRTGGASGQVRGTAESVPEEAPQSALHQPQDQRQADGASGGDRADRAEDGGTDRSADGTGRGRDGGTESDRYPALDGPDEQSPAQRGGTGADRPDLRLTTEEPTEAGSDELSASAVIDAAQQTIKELFEQYKQTVAAALVKDTAFVNACRNSDRENAIMEGADAIRRIVNESGDLQLAKLYFDMPAFHNRLHQELLEETYPKLVNAADHSPFKPYQVAAYHHIENGFDDKLDYQTLEEAEAAAQGYVAGTMEEDGFAYDGAAVYDAETHQCLRVYGDYPDEKAQEQAAAFALEHDAVTSNGTELPAFLDMHLIEANLLDDGGRKHKRQEIFEYFQAHENLTERTEFLKNSYNDIWVEVLTGGVRTGYHAEKDGLLMWEGSYLSRTSESVFSWPVITEMTEGLIERGEYKIKLGLQNAPVMAEQLALFDMGGDAPVYEAPADTATGILAPARTVPQEVIDLALCTGGNEPNSAERIAVFYMRERPEQENISFLRREFGRANGRGIEYEGRKYAVWFLEDGIHLAQGDSVRTGYSKTVVTWEQASARILELLDAGTYLSASELAQAQDKVLHEAMDALLMTARDLNEEGRGQGLFPQTLAIHDQHKGYPELDEDMVAFAKTEGGLQTLAQEYHAFLDAYAAAPDIMRFRISGYNTHRIGVVLDGLSYPERSFTAQPSFLRQCKMFITQDEIDQHFLNEGTESRLTIYSHFCYPHTPEEHQKFIKSQFGEYSGGSRAGYGYTKTYKGLDYERDYNFKKYDAVHLTIPNVAKEYERLIAQKRFPGEDAIAKIPEYERGQLARIVYNGFYNAPDDVPHPYPKGADYYDALPMIEEQLQDKGKTAEMLAALTSRLDGTDESKITYADGSYVDAEGGTLSSTGLYWTDKEGKISISGISGTIVATEVQTIPGYAIDENTRTQTVVVNPNDTQTLYFYNTPVGGLQIIKSDKDSGKRISGVKFEIRKMNGEIIGTYTTDSDGVIYLPEAESGWYTVTELEAASGYLLDTTPHRIEVKDGQTATLEITNHKSSRILLHKVDKATGKGIYGAVFLLYDSNRNPIGEYVTDQDGYIYADEGLADGRYYLREIKAAPGYVLDPELKTIYVRYGSTTEIEWSNTAECGQIQIIKKSADDNATNGLPAGTLLEGAVFEIYDKAGNVVDTIKSDRNGRAVSKTLPLSRYTIREIKAPANYSINPTVMTAYLEFNGQIVTFEAQNASVSTGISVKKTGPVQAVPGQPIRYVFSQIKNSSNVALDSFYWRDQLPAQVTLSKIVTGSYNQPLSYKVVYKTNLSGDYRTLADNLSTSKVYVLDARPAVLGLAANERVTEVMFVFGNVKAGFAQVETPYIYATARSGLANNASVVNVADVGGLYNGQWIQAVSRWLTTVYTKTTVKLPKTGY